jgi:phosphoglycolate phosphatase
MARLTLVLFDIDGTLMRTEGAGRAAMARTAQQLFGRPDLFDALSFAGSVDLDILHRAFSAAGIAPTPRRIGRFRERYVRNLRRLLPVHPAETCPGVVSLLDHLAGRVSLGLQTGNFEAGAQAKLQRVGLWTPFGAEGAVPIGGFGGLARDRSELVPLALQRARRRGRLPDRVVVVGDTPADILASRAGMATLGEGAPALRTLAVETGWAAPGALEASRPDLHVADLEQGWNEVLDLILGE